MKGRDSDRLDPLVDQAVKALKDVFTSDDVTPDEMTVARMATSLLATWAKLRQSERASDAMLFGMARELAADKAELARYVSLTMPDTPLVRVLEAKKLPELEEKK